MPFDSDQQELFADRSAPLAERMRPRTLDEIVGQDHLLGKGRLLRRAIERDEVPSMILWGPPGSGKTTLAQVIARVEGLTVARLRSFTATRCVEPLSRDGQTIFAEPDVARLQLLCEISADFDLDEEAAALVLSLVDQIHG